MVSGVASYGVTMAAGSAAVGGAGFTLLGVTMGPVGWALLLVAALGVAIWTAVNAAGTDESNLVPVEYWLDNGIFGKRAQAASIQNNPFATKGAQGKPGSPAQPFATLSDEVQALERIILVASGRFLWEPSRPAMLIFNTASTYRYTRMGAKSWWNSIEMSELESEFSGR